MKVNLSKSPKKRKKNISPRRKAVIISLVSVLGLFLIYYIVAGVRVIADARSVERSFAQAQTAVADQDFKLSLEYVEQAKLELIATANSLRPFSGLKSFPVIGTQLRATNHIVTGGGHLTDALLEALALADEIFSPFTAEETISLASLTPDDKGVILEKISQATPVLDRTQALLRLARDELAQLPSSGLIGPLAEVQQQVNDNLPLLDQFVESAIPLVEIVPNLAGHPETNSYLFLLQNNAELRPTGGFIGTYGVIEVNDGEIIEFTSDNVYNLDSASGINVTPPLPLQRYVQASKWFLRDSNWSPDFPTSAEQAIWFYEQEGGPAADFDGVIAITPTFISRLLTITGPLTVEDITFTQENFEAELYYQVSQGFLQEGIAFVDRKDIIGDLGTLLITKLLSLPQERWGDLWEVLIQTLDEKQFLLYSRDSEAQAIVLEQNWGGAVQESPSDYLTIVDANLASLKTDPDIERAVTYQLEAQSTEPRSTASLTYKHTGEFDIRTTRYRTYVRFYVPLGSKLIAVTGNDNEVITTEDLGKTVFATFMVIEPGDTETLTFEYSVSDSVKQSIINGQYELLIQKQPGTSGHTLEAEFLFANSVKNFTPKSGRAVDKSQIKHQTDLLTDRIFKVGL